MDLKITVLVPTLNEIDGMRVILPQIKKEWYHQLIVVDGGSTDGTVEYAREKVRNAPLYAAIGGFHLYALDDAKLDWTAQKLKEFGLKNFLGAHCTGIEAVQRIRTIAGLDRKTASVGAVGGVFELGKPMDPGSIAR